jgi:hypothetical protein
VAPVNLDLGGSDSSDYSSDDASTDDEDWAGLENYLLNSENVQVINLK